MIVSKNVLSRRQALQRIAMAGAALPLFQLAGKAADPVFNQTAPPYPPKREFALDQHDRLLLEEIQKASFKFFWENAHPKTGLIKDRSSANGPDDRTVASIASTGFGLTSYCIASKRGWESGKEIQERVRKTLRFLVEWMPQEHGFNYHFVDWSNGRRVWNSELSSIDTAILMCGVIMCGEFFADLEIRDLAVILFDRVNWEWMLNGGDTLCHGWLPETGFLPGRWDHYSELMLLYLLAIGADSHRIPVKTWDAWKRPIFNEEGLRYIGVKAPLFVHQYAHAWFDFYGVHDRHANYFDNSILATEAHRRFCLKLSSEFPHYSEGLWGINASDSINGYTIWGGPPKIGPIDGTVVPCAAGGSLPFLTKDCMRVLHYVKNTYSDLIWKKYGMVDAFNPQTGWVARDVIGIDVGITMLMAENARTGFVWDTFKKNRHVRQGMERAKFKPAQHVRANQFLPK
jgi:hypothetical protein